MINFTVISCAGKYPTNLFASVSHGGERLDRDSASNRITLLTVS